ncbi:xylitol oxidase [Aeromicrobium panaciterrae]|uniref:Xylitol oxidase n=1 Tax=Aeromicrobium panaciterrae TaxID=363861 RepID=A0ABU1UM25_9ACTN|nr:D-arabinono-1,4-lactone oxidase [Aeromicrobium panaciterrae]MDR7086194.1 xylitol oxidase [Aeromicrobium panaciterrae]
MTRNWAGNIAYDALMLLKPSSVEELQEIVSMTPRIRPLGSRHSFNRIADTDAVQVTVEKLPEVFEIDGSTVTVGAGVRYGEMVGRLHDAGWALHNLASLPHISIAGAVATGTHGSGDGNGSLATAVAGLQMVTAGGELLEIRRGDPDFDGMVVSLGLLGVVTHVTLDIEPTYEVSQHVFENLSWSAIHEHFDEITSSAYSVSLFTDWGDGASTVWLKSRNEALPELYDAVPATANVHPLPGLSGEFTTLQLGQPGPWWDRLPHFRLEFTPSNGEELQTEYLVPRTHALEAIDAVRALAAQVQPLLLVSEIRTIAADNLWLSPSHDVDCVALHFTWRQDIPGVTAFLPTLDDALAPFAARPHWGKLFETTPDRLMAAYPKLDQFRELAEQFDPTGMFANDLTKKWLGQS